MASGEGTEVDAPLGKYEFVKSQQMGVSPTQPLSTFLVAPAMN